MSSLREIDGPVAQLAVGGEVSAQFCILTLGLTLQNTLNVVRKVINNVYDALEVSILSCRH